MKKQCKLKVAVLCGGPSLERGISLNSARSVCDHLSGDDIEVLPIYFDYKKTPYQISRAQLYSNTPSDFDFKLHSNSKPLSKTAFRTLLKSVDIAFPVMHGAFGEDGAIQRILERYKIPYLGSDSEACKRCFDKYLANEFIASNGFYTLPSMVLKSHLSDHKKLLIEFFSKNKIQRAIVKPATGGSSISVFSVDNVEEALEKVKYIFSKRIDTRVVVEPFCEGIEFTVIVLQNRFGLPVAILPTEMEMDYRDHQIFDYRRKYLATNQVRYHCPPRFDNHLVEKIQIQAEQLFQALGMRDFARFDGWLMPDGNLWFSDFNPISGMEQNSFLFQQSSQVGFSHADLLRFVLRNACEREGIAFPETPVLDLKAHSSRKDVNIIFGGATAERQVSLMSGTNVWLKLRKSKKYNPIPYLLCPDGRTVWKLPYAFTLNHTVEEIAESCQAAESSEKRLQTLKQRLIEKLNPYEGQINEEIVLPEKLSLDDLIDKSERVFIGLHGGIGEDGTLQTLFEKKDIKYNGSGPQGSQICMDKYRTAVALKQLEKDGVYTAKKHLKDLKSFKNFKVTDYELFWRQLHRELGSKTVIVKPRGDGCSAGIVRLYWASDLQKYVKAALDGLPFVKEGTFSKQHGIIEMPTTTMKELMFEQFIETDRPRVIKDKLKWGHKTGWVEVTVGVIGKGKDLRAMNPSLTVAEGNILSLEEKFQGGTGINITPPPQPFVKKEAISKAKIKMVQVAHALQIRGYARIDAFMHIKTGELIIIEANSTPGLTASTVIYHQALEENPPMYPTEFLEKIMDLA